MRWLLLSHRCCRLLFLSLWVSSCLHAQSEYGLLNINDVSFWVRGDGVGVPPNGYLPWNVMYPRGKAGMVGYDGLLWVGKVFDGTTPVIRTEGNLWQTLNQAGAIISPGVPETPRSHVYRIRRDWKTADLQTDAAEFFNTPTSSVTDSQVASVRSNYENDWNQWPWQKGAPFRDLNANGIMDGDDYPDMLGADQVLWFVHNDLRFGSFGGPPIGLEVQTTLWAHRGIPQLDNVVFKRWRLIYKGSSASIPGSKIDSMYVGIWADTDVGFYGDDLAGCDSTANLAFAYNGPLADTVYSRFTKKWPAVCYSLLQGPVVPGTSSDVATFKLENRPGFRNLGLSSVFIKPTPSAIAEPDLNVYSYYFWKAMRGYVPFMSQADQQSPWLDPAGHATKFPLSGDPPTKSGWVDGTPGSIGFETPGGRRFTLNSGPFTMSLGDTQEVVAAIVVELGVNSGSSVGMARYFGKAVQYDYPFDDVRTAEQRLPHVDLLSNPLPYEYRLGQNYPNPFNPSTTIEYSLPVPRTVRLAVFDLLGREVRLLDEGEKPAGFYSKNWDGRNNDGELVPSGIYFCRLTAESVELTRKLVIVR